jgi:hypothetical protein
MSEGGKTNQYMGYWNVAGGGAEILPQEVS